MAEHRARSRRTCARQCTLDELDARRCSACSSECGFSDAQIAHLHRLRRARPCARAARCSRVMPAFKTVDTCAAEFPSDDRLPLQDLRRDETEVRAKTRQRRAMILGAGPNRIGQGIEFDYCCVHAAYALAKAGFETIMVNCNPETVSTDYDTSDKLYFEPLTFEDVMDIVRRGAARRRDRARSAARRRSSSPHALDEAGVPIMGTSPEAIDLAEDRDRFARDPGRARHHASPAAGMAVPRSKRPATIADQIGFPLLVRPSYVLGGRGMVIVYDERAAARSTWPRPPRSSPDRPDATSTASSKTPWRCDVDALSRRRATCTWAACWSTSRWRASTRATRPAARRRSRCPEAVRSQLRSDRAPLALRLGVVGLINIQFAIKDAGRLHHRGEPARQPHRAVRLEGHRRAAARKLRRAHHGGREDRGLWACRPTTAASSTSA